MLADTKLRALKATGKLYKVADRDGLYVAVTPAGAISFRYNYKVGRRQWPNPTAFLAIANAHFLCDLHCLRCRVRECFAQLYSHFCGNGGVRAVVAPRFVCSCLWHSNSKVTGNVAQQQRQRRCLYRDPFTTC